MAGVRFATGVHPHQAGSSPASQPTRRDWCATAWPTSGACAIGEIGLDYHYDFSPRDVQQDVFRAQLRLARELGCRS